MRDMPLSSPEPVARLRFARYYDAAAFAIFFDDDYFPFSFLHRGNMIRDKREESHLRRERSIGGEWQPRRGDADVMRH